MDAVYEQWRKEVERKLAGIPAEKQVEKIQAIVRRCPQCRQLGLEFDPNTGIIKCSRCGFEVKLKMIK